MDAISLVYVTCPDAERALAIGRQLVEEGLAACANVLPGMRSVYRWQGRIETADEAVLLVKIPRAAYPAVEARLGALHPYQVPCIIELPADRVARPYRAWLLGGG